MIDAGKCNYKNCKKNSYDYSREFCHDHIKIVTLEKYGLNSCEKDHCFIAIKNVEEGNAQPAFCPTHMPVGQIVSENVRNILQEADKLTSGDRAQAYGPAKENFGKIATMWSAYKGVEFSARDIAMMMVLVKISRDSYKPKRDNLVDGAGYFRTAEMIDE